MRRIVLLLILLASPVYAGDVSLSWTPPVRQQSCVDAGELTNLAGFRLYVMVADIADPVTDTITFPDLKAGEYRYVATAYTDAGVESNISNSTLETVDTFVVKEETAYYVIQQPGRFIMLPIGTVPLGTSCDQDQEINKHFAVPRDSVTYTGTARPYVVVAKCG